MFLITEVGLSDIHIYLIDIVIYLELLFCGSESTTFCI